MSIEQARMWLNKITQRPKPEQPVNVLTICGGHERTIARSGLRTVLAPWLNLIPGPGCPICVCPEHDIALAIAIAQEPRTIIVSFGDMLRVPVNRSKQPFTYLSATNPYKNTTLRSLTHAHAAGADIRAIASPMDAFRIAKENPGKQVIFFAVGFETTMAPVAALATGHLKNQLPVNLRFLISGRRTWPIVNKLLKEKQTKHINGIIAPGHVATIMGIDEWQFAAQDFAIPTAVAGFDANSLLQACHSILSQNRKKHAIVDNCYPSAVRTEGNTNARDLLDQCFSTVDASWRGIGVVTDSGFELRNVFDAINARKLYAQSEACIEAETKDCRCADIVMARRTPDQCPLFSKHCNPTNPHGPCMVSGEGACQIWWQSGGNSL